MFKTLTLTFALSTFTTAWAVTPRVGRIGVYTRTCAEVLDPGISIHVVTPPLHIYAARALPDFTFDRYGSNVMLMHQGPRHEVQATVVSLNSAEISRSIVSASRVKPAHVLSKALGADSLHIQVEGEDDAHEIFDGADPIVRAITPTPHRHYQKLTGELDINDQSLASPLNLDHPYFVTSRLRRGRFKRASLATRLVDWRKHTVVALNADPRYLSLFEDPVSLPAQKLALVEPGARSIRLVSMDAFEQCLRPEGSAWSGYQPAPPFARAPVITLAEPLRRAFWLADTTRLVTVTPSGVAIWDGTTGQRLDYIAGDYAAVDPIRGQSLLRLTTAWDTELYAIDQRMVIRTFTGDTAVKVFDRSRDRAFALTQAGQIHEIKREGKTYAVNETKIKLEVDPANAQIGAVETKKGRYLVVAGFDASNPGGTLRTYQIKVYPLGDDDEVPARNRNFLVRKDASSTLSPTGSHLIFGIDEIRTAIVNLNAFLETDLGL